MNIVTDDMLRNIRQWALDKIHAGHEGPVAKIDLALTNDAGEGA